MHDLAAMVHDLRSPLAGIANMARRKGVPFHDPLISVRTGDTPQQERARFRRDPAEILITEGFLLFHDESVRKLFDLKIYLDIPKEAIIARRAERNRSGKDKTLYYQEVVVKEYEKHGLPTRKYADIVVDGLASPESNAHYIAQEIKSLQARMLHAARDP